MANSSSYLKTTRTINNKSVLISWSCLGTNIFPNLAEVIKRPMSLAKLLKDILKSLKFYQRTFTPAQCCDKRIPSKRLSVFRIGIMLYTNNWWSVWTNSGRGFQKIAVQTLAFLKFNAAYEPVNRSDQKSPQALTERWRCLTQTRPFYWWQRGTITDNI